MLARRPKKGDRIWWPESRERKVYRVLRTPDEGTYDSNLCWIEPEDGSEPQNPFIWRFHDGLNKLAEFVDGE